MFHNLIKKIFVYLENTIQAIRVLLVFLSFFVILYWILQLAGATFTGPVAAFFEGIKDFTHLFYNRSVTIDKATIDFSFLISSLSLLLIVWGLNFFLEYLKGVERKYDNAHAVVKKQAENLFNAALEQEHILNEYKNNKILFIINFIAKNLEKDKFFTKDANSGVEEKQQEILDDFFEILEGNFDCQGSFIDGSLLLNFEGVKDIDKKLSSLKTIINASIKKYENQGWGVNFQAGIDVYAKADEIEPKTKKLVKLVKLGLKDKIACLGTFKERYSLVKNKKYRIEGCGVYKIDEEEDVFSLEGLK